MINQLLLFLSLTLLSTKTLAQSPAAAAPAPPGPLNVTKILEKGGQFTLFIRLMKSTSVADQINGQLNNSNNGLTIFAPSDNAFSSLKAGTLNSLTGQQQIQLVQFHIVPNYLSTTQFQTATNPLRTQAGDVGAGQFPLNVTTMGNQVNVSTGVMNTSVSGTIYTDNQLAVYQVDKVLLPWSIFGAPVPTAAPAPAPVTPRKRNTPAATSPSAENASGAVGLSVHGMVVSVGVAVVGWFVL